MPGGGPTPGADMPGGMPIKFASSAIGHMDALASKPHPRYQVRTYLSRAEEGQTARLGRPQRAAVQMELKRLVHVSAALKMKIEESIYLDSRTW
jgi:hypothetical protein